MRQQACGCPTRREIRSDRISGVKTLTLIKSMAFFSGLIACQNQRREKERQPVEKKSCQRREKESV